MSKLKKAKPIYQLKITLLGSKPPIFRRVLMHEDMKLDDLHKVIQIVFDWTNSHLHSFFINNTEYCHNSNPLGDKDINDEDEQAADSRQVILKHILPREKGKIMYTYDFGDSWDHQIVVEKKLQIDTQLEYPYLVAGKRKTPPEDCGGIWGYEDLLVILADPKHAEHDDMLEYLGIDQANDWDTEKFDVVTYQEILRDSF